MGIIKKTSKNQLNHCYESKDMQCAYGVVTGDPLSFNGGGRGSGDGGGSLTSCPLQ